MRNMLFRLAAPLLCLLVAGCTPLEEDLCDLKCDCEGCSDSQYDDCLDHYDDDYRHAENRDCFDQYDDLVACEDDTGRCDGNDWETSCKDEHDDYKDCVD